MAIIEMKVPSPGESVNEVQIAHWIKKDGDFVNQDEELCEIDSDKATLTLNAEAAGVLKILVKEGETVTVGAVVCSIDTTTTGKPATQSSKPKITELSAKSTVTEAKNVQSKQGVRIAETQSQSVKEGSSYADGIPSVAAAKIMKEKNISTSQVIPTGKDGRITKADVLQAGTVSSDQNLRSTPANKYDGSRNTRREKMSMLRKRIAERLVAVKQETAMLTTFNEVDMTGIMNIRKQYKDAFKETYGVSLGFMSFFTKAVCEALHGQPSVNSQIDGNEIVYHDYCDIGIAVSAPKGLMVPVIRNAELMNFAQIEQTVAELATRARDGKITIEEMTGGTFTITNGGVFGSMLSTPIINPPQSAILGMHNIVDRPVAVNGHVEIRPIMYVALSYDHRVIDGKESVGFLVKVKEMLEQPVEKLFDGKDPGKFLFGK